MRHFLETREDGSPLVVARVEDQDSTPEVYTSNGWVPAPGLWHKLFGEDNLDFDEVSHEQATEATTKLHGSVKPE